MKPQEINLREFLGNFYDLEVEMVQRTLGGTCLKRTARGTRALELGSKVPALARDTNVPNKRVCLLFYQKTSAHQIPHGPCRNPALPKYVGVWNRNVLLQRHSETERERKVKSTGSGPITK